MTKRKLNILYVLLILALGCSEDTISDPNYPTVVKEASNIELNTLLDQIDQTALGECISLNAFGFPFTATLDSCINYEEWFFDITKAQLIRETKQAIHDFGYVLNCEDSSKVSVLSIRTSTGIPYSNFFESYPDSLPPVWRVTTNSQNYDGIAVKTTNLDLYFSPEGLLSVSGNWFSFIYIPETDVYTEESAKVLLYDKLFTYGGSKITPGIETFWHNPKKIIFPIKRSSRIELRVCWALFPENWEFIVDSQSGEILSSIAINEI